MQRPLTLAMLIATCLSAGCRQETLRELDWSKNDRSGDGQVLESGPATPFARLEIVNRYGTHRTYKIGTFTPPTFIEKRYAIVGRIRFQNVLKPGYIEVCHYYPNNTKNNTRSDEMDGPGCVIEGSGGWQDFLMPFTRDVASLNNPERIDLALVMPGKGTVELGPIRLVEYGPLGDPLTPPGAWWSSRASGIFAGIGAILLGGAGVLIGTLTISGRSQRLVQGLLAVTFLVGIVGATIGATALISDQPTAVYYPILILGVLCLVLPPASIGHVRRRFASLKT
jgi:hypothetical protein